MRSGNSSGGNYGWNLVFVEVW